MIKVKRHSRLIIVGFPAPLSLSLSLCVCVHNRRNGLSPQLGYPIMLHIRELLLYHFRKLGEEGGICFAQLARLLVNGH